MCDWQIGIDPKAYFSLGANLPFDKLRANGQAFPFALSLSKGKFRANGQAFPFALNLSKGGFPPS
jgi:hypothetical protein